MPGHPDFQPVDPAVVPRFADVATFLRTRRHEISDAVDVGLVGVPFDIGLNYRPGARQGPAGVREASRYRAATSSVSSPAPSRGATNAQTISPLHCCSVSQRYNRSWTMDRESWQFTAVMTYVEVCEVQAHYEKQARAESSENGQEDTGRSRAGKAQETESYLPASCCSRSLIHIGDRK